MTNKNTQTEANKRWQEKDRQYSKYLSDRSRARSFSRNLATLADIQELEKILNDRKMVLLKAKELNKERDILLQKIKNLINKKSEFPPHFDVAYLKKYVEKEYFKKTDGSPFSIDEIEAILVESSIGKNRSVDVVSTGGSSMYSFPDIAEPWDKVK